MKIATIVGARPQFIKAAVLSKIVQQEHEEILIHTGQHYDYNMSDIFFNELAMSKAKYNLGVGGGGHGKMTGEMLVAIEKVLLKEKPDMAIVYGDTNSTLAGSLASVKLHIPVCHIEAGVRVHDLKSPEEVNRITTDHVSEMLFCCTKEDVFELEKEGLGERAYLVGDLMYDAFIHFSKIAEMSARPSLKKITGQCLEVPSKYYYLTCHREENTNDDTNLTEILRAMQELTYPCVYPVHPRNQKRVEKMLENITFSNIIFCEPVGYLTSLYLISHAEKIITDSGGLQREAFFAKKQCVTIFDKPIWPQTMIGNRNQIASALKEDVLVKLMLNQEIDETYTPFGDGFAAERIMNHIKTHGIIV